MTNEIFPCERCGLYTAALDDDWCIHCICEVEGILGIDDEEWDDAPTVDLLRHYYTPEDLEHRIEEYEKEYGLPSEALMRMWIEESKKPIDLSHRERAAWLSYYRELREQRRGERQ